MPRDLPTEDPGTELFRAVDRIGAVIDLLRHHPAISQNNEMEDVMEMLEHLFGELWYKTEAVTSLLIRYEKAMNATAESEVTHG